MNLHPRALCNAALAAGFALAVHQQRWLTALFGCHRIDDALMDGKSKASRKRRIAQGAGVQIQDVNRLLNQFDQMQSMMKKMKGGGLFKMMKRMGGMKGLPGMGR